jgi:hypothetical protein
VLRVLEACRGKRTSGPLILRPVFGKPIDRRDAYRMVAGITKAAGIPRHISPHSKRHAVITNSLDAGVPSATPRFSATPNPNHRALRPRPWQPRPTRRPLPDCLRRRRLNGLVSPASIPSGSIPTIALVTGTNSRSRLSLAFLFAITQGDSITDAH